MKLAPPHRRNRPRRRAPRAALAALFVTLAMAAACDKPTAFGEADSLIVIADAGLWSELEDETYAVLEPTLFTVRDERTFHVTHVPDDGSELDELLLWRQVLVFAPPDDPRVAEIMDAAERADASVGEIVQARDVWARNQLATAILLDPADPAGSWRRALPEVADILDRQFREYATSRMFVSGVDTAFAARLAERYGVGLRAPRIYHGAIGEDGRIRLRNDRPSPSDRIRSILVERGEPVDSLDAEALFAWREGIDSVAYNVAQRIERPDVDPRRFEVDGAEAIQVQGIWHDEGAYPAAGPFLTRAVRCPDATWYFDAWLYAPHPEDSKYEYLLQLEEILDSFRCTTE